MWLTPSKAITFPLMSSIFISIISFISSIKLNSIKEESKLQADVLCTQSARHP